MVTGCFKFFFYSFTVQLQAKNIRMYETHVPGFCYLRNGECRKRTASMTASSIPDPVQVL